MRGFERKGFECEKVCGVIVAFYEDTGDYWLRGEMSWRRWFKPVADMYELI